MTKPKIGDWRIVKDPHEERYTPERFEDARVGYGPYSSVTGCPGFQQGWRAPRDIRIDEPFVFATADEAIAWVERELKRPLVVAYVRGNQ